MEAGGTLSANMPSAAALREDGSSLDRSCRNARQVISEPRLIRPPSVVGAAIGTSRVHQHVREFAEAVRVGLDPRRGYLTRSWGSNHEHGHGLTL